MKFEVGKCDEYVQVGRFRRFEVGKCEGYVQVSRFRKCEVGKYVSAIRTCPSGSVTNCILSNIQCLNFIKDER
jgi:hypothetical protein